MRAGKIYGPGLVLVLVLLSFSSLAAENKAASIWTSVQFNKRTVVVGEPVLVTITIYTSTWFTSPPEFSEIQVPNAIMVDYKQRTGSMSKTIGNRSYPAIEKKYLVYPLKEGENSLPSMSIVVESPPEGDYKSKRRVIKSPERSFHVAPVPEGLTMETWLTAYNVRLSETWNKSTDQLRQGDVLDRRITIEASGALAALIPPLDIVESSFGNLYSRTPSLNNVQNQSSFTGTRTETWTYLMESEGSYTIPGISVSWYNPVSQKVESAQIGAREITIVANPDMDFLLSMQDSLQAMLEIGEKPGGKSFQWMGLKGWQLALALLTLSIILYLLYRLIHRIVSLARDRKIAERDSEERFFKDFMSVSREGDSAAVMGALLSWYDRYRMERYGPVFGDFICAAGDPELKEQFERLEGAVFARSDPGEWSDRKLAELVAKHRKILSGGIAPLPKEEFSRLNPFLDASVNCKNIEK